MTLDDFWKLIDDARDGDGDAEGGDVAHRLSAALVQRPAEEIYAFLEHQATLMTRSYSWPLWGAAYLANGGCSDDGFDYFRGWLLAQGRDVFEAALQDPDSLDAVIPDGEEVESEDMIAAAPSAYKTVTGAYPKGPKMRLPALGSSWDFDDAKEMQTRYPRLWARRCGG